jgi:hypothetical protein
MELTDHQAWIHPRTLSPGDTRVSRGLYQELSLSLPGEG